MMILHDKHDYWSLCRPSEGVITHRLLGFLLAHVLLSYTVVPQSQRDHRYKFLAGPVLCFVGSSLLNPDNRGGPPFLRLGKEFEVRL